MTNTVQIYALRCPLTGLARYVGAAKNPKVRLGLHAGVSCNYVSPVSLWLYWLRRQHSTMPAIEILETVEAAARSKEAIAAEKRWMNAMIDAGNPLLNMYIPGRENTVSRVKLSRYGTLHPVLRVMKNAEARARWRKAHGWAE